MAKGKVEPKDGKFNLRGSKDTDLEGIDDKKYNVFTEEEKLAEATQRYPDYTWFVSYTIEDKNGNVVSTLPEYTLKFDRPDKNDSKLYYYLNGTVHEVPFDTAADKGNKKRVKAKLNVGDPPNGVFP